MQLIDPEKSVCIANDDYHNPRLVSLDVDVISIFDEFMTWIVITSK